MSNVIYVLLICFGFQYVMCSELTFELPDGQTSCYHQELKADVKSVIEYQVITGGKYDVDVSLKGPNGEVLYNVERKQYDTHEIVPTVAGEYKLCFSNAFSTFAHKVVYFEWLAQPEKKIASSNPTALTQMESSALKVHDILREVEDYQTSFRHREAQGRFFAEELRDRILYWSCGQSLVILLVGFGQVLILKSFFQDKKTFSTKPGITT